jgi:RHS repeat-associated protein
VQGPAFAYDAADRISRITNGIDSALTQSFGYDALSRLTSVASTASNESYQYDANGNRTSQIVNGVSTTSAISATSNRLVSFGGTAFGYDANGNTISVAGAATYHYDAFNRMDSAAGTSYYVNPEGQRLRKSGGAGTSYFAPDQGNAMLSEYTGGWVDYVWLNGRLVGRVAGGQLYAVHNDQVRRPEAVTNASKAIVWRAQNFAFNQKVVTSGITLNLGFPGQYYDAETLAWNNGFRDYKSELGRYLESDPIGLDGGANTYAYASSNPVSRIDLLGLDDTPCVMNPSNCGWDRPPPSAPSDIWPRSPDYATFQIDVYVFSVSATYTVYGDIFLGKGTGRQFINPLSRGC